MTWAASTRKSILLLLALVLGHLVVISRQVDGGRGVSLLERLILAALSPAQRLLGGGVRAVSGAWRGYVDLRDVHEQNRRLREQVDTLEQLLQEKQDQVREAERLRALLEIKPHLPPGGVVAEVVSREGVPWFRSVMVNRGSQAGVSLNDAVVTPRGVVGRVVAVGPHASRVQLLLDRDCSAGALIERTRASGVVQGQVGFADRGTTELVMKFVASLADVVVGDVVVTSGLDGIYPKGLVVGRVRSVAQASGLFKEIAVAPSAAFDQVEEVLIVRRPPEDRSLVESVR